MVSYSTCMVSDGKSYVRALRNATETTAGRDTSLVSTIGPQVINIDNPGKIGDFYDLGRSIGVGCTFGIHPHSRIWRSMLHSWSSLFTFNLVLQALARATRRVLSRPDKEKAPSELFSKPRCVLRKRSVR